MKHSTNKISAKLKLLVLVLMGCLGFHSASMAQALDSKGTDFWLTFPGNYDGGQASFASFFITADENATGTVSIPGVAFSTPFSVTAGTITTIMLPNSAFLTLNDVVQSNGIHVISNKEVTIYGLNQQTFTTDAYLALPTDVLGTDYVNLGYNNVNIVNGTQFGVVATQDNTIVTVTPSSTALGHTAGVPYTVNLNQGQTYLLRNTNAAPADLSGSLITSDKPIAVFGSHQCANIPDGNTFACDYLVEELPPTTEWGKNFVTVPLKTRTRGDTYRILAGTNATTVSINGAVVATLNRGQFFETNLAVSSQITADQPILVAQYSNGTTFDGITSDPFMMLITPFEQFLGGYTISTPATGFSLNFVNVVAPTAAVGSLMLDGVVIPPASFSPIGASGFSGAQIDIALGSHNVTGPGLPFGLFVYGFDQADSYGYPGGQSFAPIATVNSLTLTPEDGTDLTGTNHCWQATVLDQFGHAVPGIRVDFNTKHSNNSTSFETTNSSGVANFCYTGTNEGLDSIIASVGTLADTSTFTWTSTPPPPDECDCITCNDHVVVVDQDVIVNFNGATPVASGDADLLPFFSFEKVGSLPSKWKAIFDLGPNKLLLKNGATIKVLNVPTTTNNQGAPGIVIKSTCDVELEAGSHVIVNSLNQNAGDIVIEAHGHLLLNGEIRDEVSGTLNRPGSITATSTCGNIWVGRTGLLEVRSTGGGGNSVNLVTCGSVCNSGDITVDGLVKSFTHNTVNQAVGRPIVRVSSFNGKVIINANTVEPLYDEYQESGTRYDIYGGLLAWSRDNVAPGKVEVQAKDSVIVNGHGADPTGPTRKSFGAVASVATMSEAPGGLVDVRSLDASIVGNDRAFDVSGRNRLPVDYAHIILWAKNNIVLKKLGANATFNPVVDASGPGVADRGGLNTLRAFTGEIIIGTGAKVSATVPAGLGSQQGLNELSSCLGITGGSGVTPADPNGGDDIGNCSVFAPNALFTDCHNLDHIEIPNDRLAGSEIMQPNKGVSLKSYPNPFSKSTSINYAVTEKGFVSVKVFNSVGKQVATLVNNNETAGIHSIQWNAGSLESGVYYVHYFNGRTTEVSKLILVR